MAEVTGMRNNALPYPVYGLPFVVVAPLLDADGDPVSPSSPDSERSLNGDTFADCTNEVTEIATSSGICYLLLTAAEMTADIVTVRIQSTGAKTTVLTLYPRKLVTLSSGTCQGSNDTGDVQLAAGDSAIDDYYNGCIIAVVVDSTTEVRLINDYVGSTKVAEVAPAFVTAQPDSNDTYTVYLPEGRHVVPANATHVAGTAQTAGDIIGDTNDIQARLPAALVSGRMDASVGAMAANTLTASALAADAVTEIAAGGGGVTIARSTGALIGTSESSGVTIAAGATETGSEVDVLGGTDSTGELSVYLVFATTGTRGTVEVRLRHARVTGQPASASDLVWQASVTQAGKVLLGRVKATRYMSAVVVNRIASASITSAAVLYELEKQS